MKRKMYNMIKMQLILTISIFVVACGGGGGSSGAPAPKPTPNIQASFSNLKMKPGTTSTIVVKLANPNVYTGNVVINIAVSNSGVANVSPLTFTLSPANPTQIVGITALVSNDTQSTVITLSTLIDGKSKVVSSAQLMVYGLGISWQNQGIVPTGATSFYGLVAGFYAALPSGIDVFNSTVWESTTVNTPQAYVGDNSYFSYGFLDMSESNNQVSIYSEGNVIAGSNNGESVVTFHAGQRYIAGNILSFSPNFILNSINFSQANVRPILYAAGNSGAVQQLQFSSESDVATSTWQNACAGSITGNVTALTGGVVVDQSIESVPSLYAATELNGAIKVYSCDVIKHGAWQQLPTAGTPTKKIVNMGLVLDSAGQLNIYALTESQQIYSYNGLAWQNVFSDTQIAGSNITTTRLSTNHFDLTTDSASVFVPFTIFAGTADGSVWYFSITDSKWEQIINSIPSGSPAIQAITATTFGVGAITSDNNFWLLK